MAKFQAGGAYRGGAYKRKSVYGAHLRVTNYENLCQMMTAIANYLLSDHISDQGWLQFYQLTGIISTIGTIFTDWLPIRYTICYRSWYNLPISQFEN